MSKNFTDTNLQFIKTKLYHLHTALMYSQSNELIRIPNNVVSVLKIDDEGYLWFRYKVPVQYINEYEQNFPARLHFFRKGISYYMEISGKATIIRNQEIRSEDVNDENPSLLIRMNILSAEYVEPVTKRKTKFETWMESMYSWTIRNIAVTRSAKPFFAKLQHTTYE